MRTRDLVVFLGTLIAGTACGLLASAPDPATAAREARAGAQLACRAYADAVKAGHKPDPRADAACAAVVCETSP